MLVTVVTVLLVCRLAGASYPMYGSGAKSRYSRSLAAWPPVPLYYPIRSTGPVYYTDNDYFYHQEPYYPIYQVPSYYMDQQRPYYYGYDDQVPESVEDVPEDLPEEDSHEDVLPYGQEMFFQDSSLSRPGDSNADINARFLQNLILAQMYNDANTQIPNHPSTQLPRWAQYPSSQFATSMGEEPNARIVYGEPITKSKGKIDENVQELKDLIRGSEQMERPSPKDRREKTDKKSRKVKENIFAAQTNPNNWDEFRSNSYKRSNDVKISNRKAKLPATTVSPQTVTPQALRGQKEVVLPRPANPPRTPDFQRFVASRSTIREREPSVYDTIKKLLHMEERLEEDAGNRVHKRSYIPSEESLVEQLGGLKKMA